MRLRKTQGQLRRPVNRIHNAFTLIELLTVIAIITLLIGILVPALSRAREQAKSAATRAILKAAGDGLDLFKNENPRECLGDGYPDSANRDDPTIEEEQHIFGAQWLVRYLMGKTLDGYIPRRNVPRELLENPQEFWEQRGWYDRGPSQENPHAPLDRVGPYLEPDGVTIERPENLQGAEEKIAASEPDVTGDTFKQPVLLDSFNFPILYYAANTRLLKARQTRAPLAYFGCVGDTCYGLPGVYEFVDNGLFTGACEGGGTCFYAPWDFAGIGPNGHKLDKFGSYDPNAPPAEADDEPGTFVYYVLDKDTHENTDGQTVVPVRRDSYILISPGPDGVYGSEDDVTNF